MYTGQVIANEFVLQQLLFQDATGELWRALESNAGRLVVLRFIPKELINDLDFLLELKRRADSQKLFSYPHAVMVHRVLDLPDLGPVFVMRHVDGPFLDQYSAQWIDVQGRFPYNLLFDVFQPVANALDNARGKGILHQNLSPKKIIVSSNEGVQVYDFELSAMIRRRLNKKGINSSSTDSDLIRYLPPEELNNEEIETTDVSCDQYALAVIIEELLFRRPFFDSQRGDLRKQIVEKQPPMLSECPAYVNAALQRSLQKNPRNRLQSCVQFMDALGGLIPVTNTVTSPKEQLISSQCKEMNMSNQKKLSDTLSASNKDSIVSFDRISSDAKQVSARKIEGKIKQERRWRQLFFLWNLLILIACIVAFICFRDHLSRVWRQRVQETIETKDSVYEEKQNRRTYGSVMQDQEQPRLRRKQQEKEVDFSESNESSFSGIKGLGEIENTPDEIRFIGIPQSGKKIVFVIDASSAMGGDKLTPWSYACGELAYSFKDLNETQSFQVVYYDEQSHRLALDEQLIPWISANEQTKKLAYQFLKQYKPIGRANIVIALKDAFSLKPDVVFLLSDQKSTKPSSEDIDKIQKWAGKLTINVIEIGNGQESGSHSAFQQLAKATQGEYRWVNSALHGLER